MRCSLSTFPNEAKKLRNFAGIIKPNILRIVPNGINELLYFAHKMILPIIS